MQRIHTGVAGTFAELGQHLVDIILCSLEEGLDRAVRAISHPAAQSEAARRPLGPESKTDTLHPAGHNASNCHLVHSDSLWSQAVAYSAIDRRKLESSSVTRRSMGCLICLLYLRGLETSALS